jgi:uncharacterized protein DUF1592/uncharacterized protein DUF1588/uncharacterized protein DUF1587/uncharacterized protein DUF1585/uncharacterized protein DUF1595
MFRKTRANKNPVQSAEVPQVLNWFARLLALTFFCPPAAWTAENPAAAHFRKEVQPILVEYCYDCHGDGMNKGKVAFDEFKSDDDLLGKHDLWSKVLKNLRAGLMPPEKKPRPSAEEVRRLENWVKQEAFGIDAKDPDPGRVTIRRLNRVEYRNTIRDLMGFDFKVDDELPPDDTGYGFDNIGDVLTVSPMLLEKYMQAAETIVAAAVPRVTRVVREKTISGSAFRKPDGQGSGGRNNDRFSFYDETTIAHAFNADQAGSYRVGLELEVAGQFDFDPGRCRVVFKVNDRELLSQEFGWHNNKKFRFDFDEKWTAGEHRMALELHPLTAAEQKKNSLDLRIAAVRVQGPQEKEHWVRPKNFELFFSKDPPEEAGARRQYAREVLSGFANKAYRRPVDDRTLDHLVAIAEGVYDQTGKGFEDGVAQAMVPVLASPRFLFRVEEVEPSATLAKVGASRDSTPSKTSLVDEYSLASRLSYFLWSTMPDEELFRLAGRGELRKNLGAQVKRMMADARSQEFVENFVGQWLQVRDVEGIDINARVVLARDSGQEGNFQRDRRRFQELRDIPDEKLTPEQRAELEKMREQFRRRQNRPQIELDRDLRRALRQETEMLFAHVLRTDRSVLELINSSYTFLNERLAKHYGITNVLGNEMRRVDLPEDHPRGGVLTHGSVLIVTSNPTRTSPVKRGLFILDNLLGTPPPPPPADIPQLEESEKGFKDRQPTLREVLAIHREKPLCSSCHNRMDPLGLALENFNALGMWREKERGQPIDAAGKLITGEPFQSVHEVKRILTGERRLDFYRCLTEKLLTYALGRGLEYYDVESVDQIVERLEKQNGQFSALLMGIIESAPFQKRRAVSAVTSVEPDRQEEQRVLTKSEL